MTLMMVRRTLGLLAVAAGLFMASGAEAQELVIRGRVIGPDNAGVAQQRVVLHRVDESGGFTIAETQSGADGAFELRAPATTDTTGVYFVAARYDEELYIGPPFRPGDPMMADQVIQVGIPSMSATAMMGDGGIGPMPGQPQEQSRTWLLVVVPLLGVLAVAAYALYPRNSIPEDRSLLIRVAEIDEEMETATGADLEELQEERRELLAQLRED
jgi:hypothetical protein